jgi:hypothetical protein
MIPTEIIGDNEALYVEFDVVRLGQRPRLETMPDSVDWAIWYEPGRVAIQCLLPLRQEDVRPRLRIIHVHVCPGPHSNPVLVRHNPTIAMIHRRFKQAAIPEVGVADTCLDMHPVSKITVLLGASERNLDIPLTFLACLRC